MDDAASIDVAGQEGQDIAALQFTHDLDRHFIGFRAANDCGKAGHTTIHQLDAPGAKLDIVDRSIEMSIHVAAIAGTGIRAGEGSAAGQFESGHRLRLQTVDEADRFNRLGGEQGRHAAVQSFAQVGSPCLRTPGWDEAGHGHVSESV